MVLERAVSSWSYPPLLVDKVDKLWIILVHITTEDILGIKCEQKFENTEKRNKKISNFAENKA